MMNAFRRRMMMSVKEPDVPTDELDYLTIIPLHEEEVTYPIRPCFGKVELFGGSYTQLAPLYYRINNGEWIEVMLPDDEYDILFYINLKKGDELQLKCTTYDLSPDDYYEFYYVVLQGIDAKFNVRGTPMSLIYGDDFKENNVAVESALFELFYGNEGLTEILNPKTFLPCTVLEYDCYSNMFYGCTGLTGAPSLPATTLAESCYSNMFYGCTNLNYIKMLATDISAIDCLSDWVNGVSSTGTFVKNKDATWDTTPNALRDSGVPAGWAVITEEEESNPLNVILNINANNGEEGVRVYNYISEKAPWISSAFDNLFIEGLYEGSMLSAKVVSAIFMGNTLVLSYEGQGHYDMCNLFPDGYLELVFND